MGLPWEKGFIPFSLANILDSPAIRWIRARNTLRFSSNHFFSPRLISSRISVNEFVSLQVIFRNGRVVPLPEEILVKRKVETADIWLVLKHVSWHPLDLHPGWM